uniref:VOC family protein n=1 Tax=Thaumasiovibrio occultus TaxID=1891184 RepID=UPI000B34AD20|nr:VOC family protein [Thaumasiovibrio occultus]
MNVNSLSTTFITDNVVQCRDFYQHYFNANVVFDCGWYVIVKFQRSNTELCFMAPNNNAPTTTGVGIMLNIKVNDVDAEYTKLIDKALLINQPPSDNPWGDRAFLCSDPIGNTLYIYSDREPNEQYKACINE